MSMTISVRLEHKSQSKAKFQRRHNERIGHQPSYVDQSRSHINSIIVPAPVESILRKRCEDLRDKKNPKPQRKMKSDAAVLTDGIITFGTEAQPVFMTLDTETQNSLYIQVVKRLAVRLNAQVVSLTVHRDESAPHAHFGFLAFDINGNPLSKVITPTISKEIQDIAGSVFADYGIKRGKSKAQRIAEGENTRSIIHRKVKQLHQDLPIEIAEAEERKKLIYQKLSALEAKLQKNLELIAKNQALIQQLGVEENEKRIAIQKRINVYKMRAEDARKTSEEMLEEHEFLREMRWERYRLAELKETIKTTNTVANKDQSTIDIANVTLSSKVEEKYGVLLLISPSRITIPPDQKRSNRQKAFALYLSAREHFEPSDKLIFNVTNTEMAEIILEEAQKDNVEKMIIININGKEFYSAPKPTEKPSLLSKTAQFDHYTNTSLHHTNDPSLH